MALTGMKKFFDRVYEALKVPAGIESQRFCWRYSDGLQTIHSEEFLVASSSASLSAAFCIGVTGWDGMYAISKIRKEYRTEFNAPCTKPVYHIEDQKKLLTYDEALRVIATYNRVMTQRCNRPGEGAGFAPVLTRI
jgi:hypothetical protein